MSGGRGGGRVLVVPCTFTGHLTVLDLFNDIAISFFHNYIKVCIATPIGHFSDNEGYPVMPALGKVPPPPLVH